MIFLNGMNGSQERKYAIQWLTHTAADENGCKFGSFILSEPLMLMKVAWGRKREQDFRHVRVSISLPGKSEDADEEEEKKKVIFS